MYSPKCYDLIIGSRIPVNVIYFPFSPCRSDSSNACLHRRGTDSEVLIPSRHAHYWLLPLTTNNSFTFHSTFTNYTLRKHIQLSPLFSLTTFTVHTAFPPSIPASTYNRLRSSQLRNQSTLDGYVTVLKKIQILCLLYHTSRGARLHQTSPVNR